MIRGVFEKDSTFESGVIDMQSWQLNLSPTDGVLFFLHMMGFISRDNQLQISDLLEYYGRSSTTEGIHRVERGKMKMTCTLCEAIDTTFIIMPREMRINSPADICLEVVDRKGVRQYGAKETKYELNYAQWCRRYLCNDLGSVELSADQVTRLTRILSELRENYRDWLSYQD